MFPCTHAHISVTNWCIVEYLCDVLRDWGICVYWFATQNPVWFCFRRERLFRNKSVQKIYHKILIYADIFVAILLAGTWAKHGGDNNKTARQCMARTGFILMPNKCNWLICQHELCWYCTIENFRLGETFHMYVRVFFCCDNINKHRFVPLQWPYNERVSIACSIVRSGADQRKHQSSALLVLAIGIHPWIPSTKGQ